MLRTTVTLCELGRKEGWDDIAKIPVEAIIKRWKAKGCEKGRSRAVHVQGPWQALGATLDMEMRLVKKEVELIDLT